MLITIYKCLNYDSFPKYLKDMFTLRQSRYSFRKTDILSLRKPVTTTYGLHSFRYFASKNCIEILLLIECCVLVF